MKDMLEAHRAWGPRSSLGNTSFDSHVARPPVQHVVTAPTLPSPVYTAVVIRKCIFHQFNINASVIDSKHNKEIYRMSRVGFNQSISINVLETVWQDRTDSDITSESNAKLKIVLGSILRLAPKSSIQSLAKQNKVRQYFKIQCKNAKLPAVGFQSVFSTKVLDTEPGNPK